MNTESDRYVVVLYDVMVLIESFTLLLIGLSDLVVTVYGKSIQNII
jgi:hypothetical protein